MPHASTLKTLEAKIEETKDSPCEGYVLRLETGLVYNLIPGKSRLAEKVIREVNASFEKSNTACPEIENPFNSIYAISGISIWNATQHLGKPTAERRAQEGIDVLERYGTMLERCYSSNKDTLYARSAIDRNKKNLQEFKDLHEQCRNAKV